MSNYVFHDPHVHSVLSNVRFEYRSPLIHNWVLGNKAGISSSWIKWKDGSVTSNRPTAIWMIVLTVIALSAPIHRSEGSLIHPFVWDCSVWYRFDMTAPVIKIYNLWLLGRAVGSVSTAARQCIHTSIRFSFTHVRQSASFLPFFFLGPSTSALTKDSERTSMSSGSWMLVVNDIDWFSCMSASQSSILMPGHYQSDSWS